MKNTKMIFILIMLTGLVRIALADLPEGWYEVSGNGSASYNDEILSNVVDGFFLHST